MVVPVNPSERESRLILQGVLLTLSAILAVALAGALVAIARGAPALSPWPVSVLVVSLAGTVAGACRWVVPEQRRMLRWNLSALGALLTLSALGALLIWGTR